MCASSSFYCRSACSSTSILASRSAACCASSSPKTTWPMGFSIALRVDCSSQRLRLVSGQTYSETTVVRVPTARTLCLSAPTYSDDILLFHSCTQLGDTAAKTKGLKSTITTKAGCKIHPCSHIQSNVMFSLNTIIIIPQPHRPQISSFGHLVRDQDNLIPSLYRSSQLSRLYCVIRVFSQYPHSLPHPIIRGPFTPQDANPIMKYSP